MNSIVGGQISAKMAPKLEVIKILQLRDFWWLPTLFKNSIFTIKICETLSDMKQARRQRGVEVEQNERPCREIEQFGWSKQKYSPFLITFEVFFPAKKLQNNSEQGGEEWMISGQKNSKLLKILFFQALEAKSAVCWPYPYHRKEVAKRRDPTFFGRKKRKNRS